MDQAAFMKNAKWRKQIHLIFHDIEVKNINKFQFVKIKIKEKMCAF